jgi:tetratricopeptide (TPR) repeat protein
LMVALLAELHNGRVVEGRLSIDRVWAPAQVVEKGTTRRSAPEVGRAALAIEEAAVLATDAPSLHVRGLARLADSAVAPAIDDLRRALRASGRESEHDSAATRTDLAAALLERWRMTGSATDAADALSQSEAALQAWPDMPAALFNKALSLEALGRRDAARAAWTKYLLVDPTPSWSDEVRRRMTRKDL